MDNDLERSVRLLEEAFATPNRGLFKKSATKLREDNINVSVTLAPDEIKLLMEKKSFSNTFYDDTLTSIFHGDKTLTGGVIHAGVPWKSTIDSLYTEFFEVLQSHLGKHNVLEVLLDLARCCSDALKVLQGLKSKIAISQIDDEKWLEVERDTWRLIFILYQDRLMSQNLMDDDCVIQYFGESEKLCVESLYKRDSLVRESQLIIDWLECAAAEKDDEVLHFSDSTVGWENTLHQLQSKETIAFRSNKQLVTQLDPDAPHYQSKVLHDIDMDDEKLLNKKIFQEIRCGKLENAQKLCRQCGHSWKAAIFEGWRLFHNPNIKENEDAQVDDGFSEMDTNELSEIEGNSTRDIWKIMALKYCKQDYLNAYEKASMGAFCGCINAILPICNSWEDYLWAYMKSMVDIRVESEIRDCCGKYMPLPDDYWAQRMSLNDVFSQLESSKNSVVRENSRNPERIIQKYIILDEIPQLLSDLESWIDDSSVSTQFLRFAAHLVLFLDQINSSSNRKSVENIVEGYIKRLIQMDETQLVSYYVSKLRQDSQVHLYAQYLEKIIDNDDRKQALAYGEDSGLDILAITKQVVENIKTKPYEIEPSGSLQQNLTDIDKYKISALDWVLFYESQRAEALRQSNAIIFSFLNLGKLDAAQLSFNKIPPNSVEQVLSEGNVDAELNQVIKEHLCYKAYLDAHEAFNEWFTQNKRKPVLPEELPETAPFPEKVAYQHRVSQYKAELERWKLTTSHLAKSAKTLLYNVLLFPDGWLNGTNDSEYLRSRCIPEVVLLLYSVLSESGLHEECVQLADTIASEKYKLYEAYSKEKLQELLTKLCESSVVLLNNKKDPWGNDPSV